MKTTHLAEIDSLRTLNEVPGGVQIEVWTEASNVVLVLVLASQLAVVATALQNYWSETR